MAYDKWELVGSYDLKVQGKDWFQTGLDQSQPVTSGPSLSHPLSSPSIVIASFSGSLWWHLIAPGSGHHYQIGPAQRNVEPPQTPQLTSPYDCKWAWDILGVWKSSNIWLFWWLLYKFKIIELYTSKGWISWYVSYTSIEQISLYLSGSDSVTHPFLNLLPGQRNVMVRVALAWIPTPTCWR